MHEPSALNRFLRSPSNLALCFFALAGLLLSFAGFVAWVLIRRAEPEFVDQRLVFPAVFIVSTALLGVGSWLLHGAGRFVRIERQREFRSRMLWAILAGTTFVILQTYGLWGLFGQREVAADHGLSDGAFAFVLMHGVHFVVALLFVVFVYLRALADRYDHEYSWGVTFSAWFWHALGVVWLVIVAAFLLAGSTLSPGQPAA